MRASAAVLRRADHAFEIEPVDLPEPRGDEVLVRIVASGVCHSDVMARTMPEGDVTLPMIFGHEGAGVVESVGPQVSSLNVGDHVVLSFDSCGSCAPCLSGRPSYCEQFVPLNIVGSAVAGGSPAVDALGRTVAHRWFGQSSFATFAIATQRNAIRVDPSLPLELLGPLGCGVQTGVGTVLNHLRPRAAATIGVFGAGAVGLSAVMAARLAGARRIVAVDVNQTRLELASELGATHVLDGSDPEVLAQLRSAVSGLDYAVDTTAVPSVIATVVQSLAFAGQAALVGVSPAQVTLDPSHLAGRSVSYVVEGAAMPQVFIPRLISWWQEGLLPFHKMIRSYPFAHLNEAVEDSLAGRTIKPVLLME